MHRLLVTLLFGLLVNGAPPKPESECGRERKTCEDLNKCSPPSEQLSVPAEVVLVMGNTGCGKSTLTKHLSRHDEDMEAVQEGADFLINGSRIGSSIASVTRVPDLMTDKDDGIHYFDCPGFEDTRGSCIEVSTTYYMKDIVRHARRVKVLLLTPHFAVKPGEDRDDLLKMLKNAAQVFRNVPAVKDSLALVVTKVSSFRAVAGGDEYEPTPEDAVKNATADFLREDVLPFLKDMAKGARSEDKNMYLRAADIVTVLLTKEDGAYTRLGVFRSPDETGSLRQVMLVEQGRGSLLRLVKDGIKYSAVQPADFGFAVSDRTKVFAYTRARELVSEMVSKLSALGAAMQEGRGREARAAADVPAREARFEEAAERVRGVAAHLNSSSGVQEFCDRVVDQAVQAEERARAEAAAATCRQLDVLQVVGDQPLVDAATLRAQWLRPVQDAAVGLEAQRDWQRFLAALYDRLNKYDALQPKKMNVRNPSVDPHNVDHYELELSKLGLATDLKSRFANLTELNTLLAMAGQGISLECLSGGRVVVRAESVLLSEAAAAARGGCSGGLRVLEVYAINTVFVDVDVTLPGAHLVVVAPRLEAVGRPIVSLDGPAGQPPPAAPREGGRGGQPGTDGRPGQPGRPGGSFLAVIAEVVGKLSVTANGGRGGDGQRGGKGGPGAAGGGNGGRGGNGGAGGFGGHKGRVLVVPLGGSPVSITESASAGRQGRGGLGGHGGDRRAASGPRRKRAVGLIILGTIAVVAAIGGAVVIAKANQGAPAPPPPLPTYSNGSPGADGVATAGRETPPSAGPVPWADVPARTQAYLRLHWAHQYRGKQIRHFAEQLQASEKFQGLANL